MSLMQTSLEHSALGKETLYSSTYQSSLLFPIARQLGRQSLSINETLPFHGSDCWMGFELSWLNSKGKPISAVGEFYFPHDSQSIVESKSFKLYLNSFNQTGFESIEDVQACIQKDLSHATSSQVHVFITPSSQFEFPAQEPLKGFCLDDLDITIGAYEVQPDFLQVGEECVEETLFSHLFRSNCPVTNQPDWATISIHYKGPQIDPAALLRYLVSYRQHQGFHEQCVEQIFMDISRHCHSTHLTVHGRFTRRGGLDINPFRSNFEPCPKHKRLARQ